MKYQKDDKVRVININYTHVKRQQIPPKNIIGMAGTIFREGATKDGGYYVKIDEGELVYLYEDELTKQ